MTKTEMKKKVALLSSKLDDQWYTIKKEEEVDSGSSTLWEIKMCYYAMTEVIRTLGGQFNRHKDGKHKVFLFDVSATAEDI